MAIYRKSYVFDNSRAEQELGVVGWTMLLLMFVSLYIVFVAPVIEAFL